MSKTPSDEIFGDAGKKAGIQIWRIEKLKLQKVSESTFGSFFSGDSYIVLNTKQNKTGKFSWNLHFWLGKESTQDERGAAAVFATQMDDYLGGGPVQFREEQDHESSTFMALFVNGVRYMKGGVSSGFKQVQINVKDAKRLLHIKGKRRARATEVEMKWSSLNSGDVFILDIGNDIVLWKGKKSNKGEGYKAFTVAQSLKNNEKSGKGKITEVEEGGHYPKIMQDNLSGSPNDIKPEIPDDVQPKKSILPATLHHVSSDSGKLVVRKVGTAPFKQDDLDEGDCYIVDNGSNGKIFVWKGKKASKDERLGALANAEKFISQNKYSPHTSIEIIPQGCENVLFQEFFSDWKVKDEVMVGFGKTYTNNRIAKVKQVKIDMKSISGNPKLAAKHGMVDDGSGKLEIWRVESALVEVGSDSHGVFYSGDCYVMLYTYFAGGKKRYIIYYWQGQDSTLDEITASAFHAVQLDNKYNGDPVQVRVVQGKEPAHLLKCFGDKPMVILSGGRSKSGKDINFDRKATNLFQVYCTDVGGSRASQVAAKAKSLNSNDTFLLSTANKCFLWKGKGTSDDETVSAKAVKDILKLENITEIEEESEPSEFWDLLGGKSAYANHPRLHDTDSHPARLFEISDASGCLKMEEVPGDFMQQDLDPNDVMLLDVWTDVYVWVGSGATETERREAPKQAKEYIKSDPRGRDKGTVVTLVKMGKEPITFTGFFPAWNPDYKYNHQ